MNQKVIKYMLYILLNIVFSYITYSIGERHYRKLNLDCYTKPYDIMHQVLPVMNWSIIKWLLLVVYIVPLYLPSQLLTKFNMYSFIFLFLRHIMSLMTMHPPEKDTKDGYKLSYIFTEHPYESSFNLTFAYAFLISLILWSYGLKKMGLIYTGIISILLLLTRTSTSQDLLVTGLLTSIMYINDIPKFLPEILKL